VFAADREKTIPQEGNPVVKLLMLLPAAWPLNFLEFPSNRAQTRFSR
jgi:hypothetical protein